MYIADETWPSLGDHFENESLALVPLGSTEQHGPHLPLATDQSVSYNSSQLEYFSFSCPNRT